MSEQPDKKASAASTITAEEYATRPDADPSIFQALLKGDVRRKADVELDANGDFRPKNLDGLWRLAQVYADSQMVPECYRGNVSDCAIAIQMAIRCRVNILTFLQSSYVVYGKAGIEAKLAIALINSSGKIIGRVQFVAEKDKAGQVVSCRAVATDATTKELIEGPAVTWEMAKAEGWTDKKGTKWHSLREPMFMYRSATFLVRMHFPDVLFGMHTTDELEDMIQGELEIPPDRVAGETKSDATAKAIRSRREKASPPNEPVDVKKEMERVESEVRSGAIQTREPEPGTKVTATNSTPEFDPNEADEQREEKVEPTTQSHSPGWTQFSGLFDKLKNAGGCDRLLAHVNNDNPCGLRPDELEQAREVIAKRKAQYAAPQE